jgi:hypothetical protein
VPKVPDDPPITVVGNEIVACATSYSLVETSPRKALSLLAPTGDYKGVVGYVAARQAVSLI